MLKLLKKILRKILNRKPKREQLLLEFLINTSKMQNEHLIAIARLSFIKPSALVRESRNYKKNAEFLNEMLKEIRKGVKENEN